MNYTTEMAVAAVANIGTMAGSAVEETTGSAALGWATTTIIDFFNVADLQEGADLIVEIGTDLIEEIYDVELDEEDSKLIRDPLSHQ